MQKQGADAIAIGSIVEGRITGITKYGAFVSIDGHPGGMVHISEISSGFVKDVNEYVKLNQTIKAVVIAINDGGKLALSIKQMSDNSNRFDEKSKKADKTEKTEVINKTERTAKAYKTNKTYKTDKRDSRDSRAKNDKSGNADKYGKATGNPEEFYPGRRSKTPGDFEDMMTKFKNDSDEKISDLKKSLNPKKQKKRPTQN